MHPRVHQSASAADDCPSVSSIQQRDTKSSGVHQSNVVVSCFTEQTFIARLHPVPSESFFLLWELRKWKKLCPRQLTNQPASKTRHFYVATRPVRRPPNRMDSNKCLAASSRASTLHLGRNACFVKPLVRGIRISPVICKSPYPNMI